MRGRGARRICQGRSQLDRAAPSRRVLRSASDATPLPRNLLSAQHPSRRDGLTMGATHGCQASCPSLPVSVPVFS